MTGCGEVLITDITDPDREPVMIKVREEMGLDNLELMIPFARTVEEAQQVLDMMAREGLRRGDNGLKIKLMCEVPAANRR